MSVPGSKILMVEMLDFNVITGSSPRRCASAPAPYRAMPGRTMSRYISGYRARAPLLAQWRMAKVRPLAARASSTLVNTLNCSLV